jgi:hypothetical protein
MYSKIKASYTEANTIAQCRVKMTTDTPNSVMVDNIYYKKVFKLR